MEVSISNIEKDIKTKFGNFYYTPNDTSNNIKQISFSIPQFPLPEVGILYEYQNKYYLEINDYDKYTKAKEIIMKKIQ